jgi:galactokinase
VSRFAEQLVAAGMSAGEAAAKDQLFIRAMKILGSVAGESDGCRAYYVPGRVEVLGKHTDYAGGRSLLCTVERGFCLIARPRGDHRVNVVNARSRARCSLALDPELKPAQTQWCNYPATVLRRLARNFPMARVGADLSFVSDLPAASGMSSSSAFMIAIYLAIADLNDIAKSEPYRAEIENPEDLAGYLGTVENGQSFGTLTGDRGVGTFGGSEDHTAILCGRAGELKRYSFCPIRHECDVPFPEDHVLSLGVSGVVAMKTGTAMVKYNRASLAARKILELWRAGSGREDSTIAAALAGSPEVVDRIRGMLSDSRAEDYSARELLDRFEQFVEESTEIIPSATDALLSGDLARFGALVDASQRGAEILLGNQVPETIALAASARSLGAVAASAFGAGFGGSVWALVKAPLSTDFEHQWVATYRQNFPASRLGCFFTTRPGPPAMRLEIGREE